MTIERSGIVKLFERASTDKKGLTSIQKQRRTVKNLKRRLLGICSSPNSIVIGRNSAYKSLDQIAKALVYVNVASTVEEAKEIVPELCGESIRVFFYNDTCCLGFSRSENKDKYYVYLDYKN